MHKHFSFIVDFLNFYFFIRKILSLSKYFKELKLNVEVINVAFLYETMCISLSTKTMNGTNCLMMLMLAPYREIVGTDHGHAYLSTNRS